MARLAANSVEDALWEQEQLNMVAARLHPPENQTGIPGFLNKLLEDSPHYLTGFFVIPQGLVYYPRDRDPRTQAFHPLPGWILDAVSATLESPPPLLPSGLNEIAAPDSLPPVQVTYFSLHREDGTLMGVAGFIWDLDRIKKDAFFFKRILSRLIGNRDVFQGAIFQSPTVITILDEYGTPFFTTSESAQKGFIALRSFNRSLPFYQVGINHRDNRFDSWVRSVARINLAIIVTMFLVIVAAAAVSLRFVFHEMELAELKSTLVSNVSHELKTPLALIRLFSETLELGRTGDPAKEKEFLRVIHKESERLSHLIDNVLDMNRIEQGQKTYRMEPTDLSGVVRGTLDAYRFQLQQEGFRLETAITEDLPPIVADGDAMTQALLNLMENAIKYSAGTKVLRVELERRDGEAVISVEDRGIGIPAREQERIFDMFYRVEKGLVHSVKGSGLGLSLVKHIVDAHRGRITVASRPGEGSRFSIHLPLADPGDGAADGTEGDRA
jgi:signal transduction histidine kinase